MAKKKKEQRGASDMEEEVRRFREDIETVRSEVGYQFNTELRGFLGEQVDLWDEDHRSGTPQSGYYDYKTQRSKAFWGVEYNFGGARLYYQFQWLYKHQSRYLDSDPDAEGYELAVEDYRKWTPWRSKLAFEVAW